MKSNLMMKEGRNKYSTGKHSQEQLMVDDQCHQHITVTVL